MLEYILLFLSGASFGSFFNVVGLRLLKNESLIKPASHCPKCQNKLQWYDLIPILSYLILKGKCRKCKSKISIIYPLIELLTALLFCSGFYVFGPTLNFLTALILSSILVIIYITDFKEYIILDELLITGGILLFIIKIIQYGFEASLLSIVHGISLFIILYLIKLLGDKLFKRESLGGGDIKLALIIGFVLGIKLGIFSIVFASFLAFPFALGITLTKKVREIPFGPFLITSLLVIYYQINFFLELVNNLFVG